MRVVSPELVYIGLGTNLGERHQQLGEALGFLRGHADINLLRVSRLYETPPMGPPQPDYLNAAAECQTSLSPEALLAALKAHEARAGRVGRVRWGPRPIDMDILLFGALQVDIPGLSIPHKGLMKRAFVLGPLGDLIPNHTPPGQLRSIQDALAALGDDIKAIPWPEGVLPSL